VLSVSCRNFLASSLSLSLSLSFRSEEESLCVTVFIAKERETLRDLARQLKAFGRLVAFSPDSAELVQHNQFPRLIC
jgi:hypothetical protein